MKGYDLVRSSMLMLLPVFLLIAHMASLYGMVGRTSARMASTALGRRVVLEGASVGAQAVRPAVSPSCLNPVRYYFRGSRGARPAAQAIANLERGGLGVQRVGAMRVALATLEKEGVGLSPVARRSYSTSRAAQSTAQAARTTRSSKAAGVAQKIGVWAKANPIKVVGASVGVAGTVGTGIGAYLCREKINELSLEQFKIHQDEIFKKAKYNKLVRRLLAEFILKNFEVLGIEDIVVLVKVMESEKNVLTKLAPIVAKSFDVLIEVDGGLEVLQAVAMSSAEAAKMLAPEVVKNMMTLAKSSSGADVVQAVANSSVEAAKIVASEVVKNMMVLVQTWEGAYVVKAVAKSSAEAAMIVASEVVKNLMELSQYWEGLNVVKAVAKSSTEAAKIVASEVVKNMMVLVQTFGGRHFLEAVTKSSTEVAKIVASEVVKNMMVLVQTWEGLNVVKAVAKSSAEAAMILAPELVKNMMVLKNNKYSDDWIQLLKDCIGNKTVSQHINENIKRELTRENRDKDFRKFSLFLNLYIEIFGDDVVTKQILEEATVTERLIICDGLKQLDSFHNYFQRDEKLREVFKCVVAFEKQYQNDYVILYHGQRFDNLLLAQLFTDLKAIQAGKERPSDFLHAHIKDFEKEFGSQEKQERHRKALRILGCFHFEENNGRQSVLFTQPSPLEGFHSNCPAHYFERNHNVQGLKAGINEVFVRTGYGKLYYKFASELEILQRKMKAQTDYGNLLCIAVPKELARDYCYPSSSGGPLETRSVIEKIDDPSRKKTKTDDAVAIYDAYKAGTFENTCDGSLVMIMLNKAVDPESGIKVSPLYTVEDENRWLELVFEYEDIVRRIRQEIARGENRGVLGRFSLAQQR